MVTFYRNINVKVENLNEDYLKATAVMENRANNVEKASTFEMTVIVKRNDFEIITVENTSIVGSDPVCSQGESVANSVIGLKIGPGYNKKVIELAGGEKGCTHIVELLIEIGRCVHQGNLYYSYEKKGLEETIKEYVLNNAISCVKLKKYYNKYK